ncbi:PREDICTED: uncharacterized protein LOC106805420 [Priapulus caudatus]|uniref:Uncharacterized protein LOC106805420 n=1 Tax=Priapulus caudatus TaxID=37621 RepID=A0ABM1DRA6_PRICU|nr:PREDICTED: uncharacterized protein LOC106805420 [Priapulus caudatus]
MKLAVIVVALVMSVSPAMAQDGSARFQLLDADGNINSDFRDQVSTRLKAQFPDTDFSQLDREKIRDAVRKRIGSRREGGQLSADEIEKRIRDGIQERLPDLDVSTLNRTVLRESIRTRLQSRFPNADFNKDLIQQIQANRVTGVTTDCDLSGGTMKISMTFKRPFTGNVFAKGFYNAGCRVLGTGEKNIAVNVPLTGCGTITEVINEEDKDGGETIYYVNRIVVMYEAEWGVLSETDRAYQVACQFGGTGTRLITAGPYNIPGLGITEVAPATVAAPSCWMKVVPGTDPLVSEVSDFILGETALLVVTLHDNSNFDVFVRDCYAHDGQNGNIALIDELGCPAHKKVSMTDVITDKESQPGETLVYLPFKVFKFPDIDQVYFQCKCRVCVHDCLGDYQPDCSDKSARSKRQTIITELNDLLPGRRDNSTDLNVFNSIRVQIPEEGKDIYNDIQNRRLAERAPAPRNGDICVAKTTFTAAAAVGGAVLMTSLIVCCMLIVRLSSRGKMAPHSNTEIKY